MLDLREKTIVSRVRVIKIIDEEFTEIGTLIGYFSTEMDCCTVQVEMDDITVRAKTQVKVKKGEHQWTAKLNIWAATKELFFYGCVQALHKYEIKLIEEYRGNREPKMEQLLFEALNTSTGIKKGAEAALVDWANNRNYKLVYALVE